MISDRARGFTLLEMLVVLAIAGMALLLATQALGQYQRAHTRAVASERNAREQRMSEAWFRASVRGLQALAPAGSGLGDDSGPFAGDTDRFTGTTLAPVFGQQGTPVRQEWRILPTATGDRLQLDEAGQALALALPRAGRLRFHYMDAEGEVHDRWPPAQGLHPQLPAAILLELAPPPGGTGGALFAAAVIGPRDPIDRPYEYATP